MRRRTWREVAWVLKTIDEGEDSVRIAWAGMALHGLANRATFTCVLLLLPAVAVVSHWRTHYLYTWQVKRRLMPHHPFHLRCFVTSSSKSQGPKYMPSAFLVRPRLAGMSGGQARICRSSRS